MADTNTYISKQKVEKWTTKEKFNALELATIETGTEYNLTGAIEESDLGSDLQTKINGKLTTPTNPSAESAITMLADGTVGTKPLSEIGGGKLYIHRVLLDCPINDDTYYITVYSTDFTSITTETASRLTYGLLEIIDSSGSYHICVVTSAEASGTIISIDGAIPQFAITGELVSDTVTEV